MVKELSPAGKIVWKVAVVIQAVMGFTMGLYLFTYGPLFYEKFSLVVDSKLAMTLTTLLFSFGMGLNVLLEVPTGAMGDALGRKKIIVWSFLFRLLFFIAMALVSLVIPSFIWILLTSLAARVFFSVSYSLYSGSFTAWCIDSIKGTDPGVGFEHLLSSSYMYRFITLIFGGVLGVACYLNGLAHLGFLIAAGICVLCTIYCLGEMNEDGILDKDLAKDLKLEAITRRIGEIIGVAFQVFRKSTVVLALVSIFATYLFVLNIVDYLWPVYLRSRLEASLQGSHWILLVVMAYSSCTIGSKVFTWWSDRTKKKTGNKRMTNESLSTWLISSCLMSSFPIIILSWLTANQQDSFWFFVIAILPLYFAFGVIGPCFETLINNYIPENHSKQRATVLSFANLLRSILILLLAVPAGGTSGETTTVGWAIPAVLLLISTVAGAYVLKREQGKERRKKEIQENVSVVAVSSR